MATPTLADLMLRLELKRAPRIIEYDGDQIDRAMGVSNVNGVTLWSGRTVHLRRGLSDAMRAYVLAHELMHVAQRARFDSDSAWQRAYEAEEEARGYFNNRFEHEANRFAHEVTR